MIISLLRCTGGRTRTLAFSHTGTTKACAALSGRDCFSSRADASVCQLDVAPPQRSDLSAIEVISVLIARRWRHWAGMDSTP